MKLTKQVTTGILAVAITVTAGGLAAAKAAAQTPDAIDNARSTAKSLQQTQANGSNTTVATAKPAPGAPAPAVKPAAIPGSKPVVVAAAAAAKPASAASSSGNQSGNQAGSNAHNQLQKVNVLPGPDGVDIEITSSHAVTPRVTKLSSPARVLVELPETVVASAQNKIPVGSGGVKGVRIGMDGKTPPTTSVVVDLDKAMAYEVTPGDAGQLILTLHAQGATPSVAKEKSDPAPAVKSAPVKAVAVKASPSTPAAKPVAAPPMVAMVQEPAVKPAAPASKPAVTKPAEVKPVVAVAKADPMQPKQQVASKETKPAVAAASASAETPAKSPTKESKPEEKKWAMTGRRDPFFSPVVQQGGSGCSTGKKCLEIGAINLRGVVKSDTGFIAVVTNNMNKAYFLRENDPVFNGYVVKITGDSVVFQETVQDKLGKSFTREVVKRIFTPAV
jgi:Tfp pilus assembly protein PilP